MSCSHLGRSYNGDCEECAVSSALGALVPEGFTRAELLECVDRELRMRSRVYPSWVARGRLKQETADREIARMRAVRQVLEKLPGDAAPSEAQGALFGGAT